MGGAVFAFAVVVIVVIAVFYMKKQKEKNTENNSLGQAEYHGDVQEPMGLQVAESDKKQISDTIEDNRFYAPEAQILIVDDEPESRAHVKSILDTIGVQYETAHSGMQCIEKVKEKEYHILLISHKMARMDGIQTLRNLKKTEGNLSAGAAVYALTPAKSDIVQDVYMREGFDGCLSKPVGEYALTYALMQQLPSELVTFSGNIKEQTRKACEAENMLRDYGIMLGQGINNCSRNVELYKKEAMEFADSYDDIHQALVNLLYDGICETYIEEMTKIKEQADKIGAIEVATLADTHIMWAQNQDVQAMENGWREFTLAWEHAIKGIREWLGLKDTFTNVTEILTIQTNGIELSDSELGSRLKDILSDLNTEHVTEAKQKLAELKQYELAEEVRVFVEITDVSLKTGDVEKARSMIQKIM